MTEPQDMVVRETVSPEAWSGSVAPGSALALVGLWADTARVHALLRDPAMGGGAMRAISVDVVAGAYPALSPHRPGAAAFERMIADLWGHRATGAADTRPWLDHGHWPHTVPLSPKPLPRAKPAEPVAFAGPEDCDQHPLGPIRAGVAEPVHLRVHARGERIARLEARLGYAHKGTLALMRGKSPRAAARFASRLSGDCTVGHAIAFARAAEAATGTQAPARAEALRAAMSELERIGAHLFDVAATVRAARATLLAGAAMRLREAVLAAAAAAFESRLMMDAVIPGGVAVDIAPGGPEAVRRLAAHLCAALPRLAGDVAAHPGLAERLRDTGRVPPAQAAALAAGGIAGIAGCAEARTRARLDAARDGAARLGGISTVPEGALSVPLPMGSGEGFGRAATHRGDAWHWLRLDGGLIASVFMCDPGWLHWPLFEAASAGADLADLAIVEASFGCGVSGVDL